MHGDGRGPDGAGAGGPEELGRGVGRPAAPEVVGGAESATASAPNPSGSLHSRPQERSPLPPKSNEWGWKGGCCPPGSRAPPPPHLSAGGMPAAPSAGVLWFTSPGLAPAGPPRGSAPHLPGQGAGRPCPRARGAGPAPPPEAGPTQPTPTCWSWPVGIPGFVSLATCRVFLNNEQLESSLHLLRTEGTHTIKEKKSLFSEFHLAPLNNFHNILLKINK